MAVPNRKDVALRIAASYRFDGSKANAQEYCRRLAAELRKTDMNWGLNWKRGKVGDQSADIVAYKDGSQVRIVDVIVAYENPDEWPSPAGPQISWHLHSIEAAGKVAWFWNDAAPEPEPEPEPDEPTVGLEARVADIEADIRTIKSWARSFPK